MNKREETASFVAEHQAELLRIVAENTSDTIVLADNEGIVRYVSPSFEAVTGFDIRDYRGMDAFDIIAPEDRDRVRRSHAAVVESGLPVDLNYSLHHADGRILHAESRVKPVMDDEGKVRYVVAVVRDVTERRTTERLLQKILDNVNAAVWSTDKDFSRYLYCSDSFERLSGLPRDAFVDSPIRIHDHIHPDDNEVLMGEIKRRLDEGEPVRQEFRWIHVPGETKWGQLTIHPQRDAEGGIERLDGIVLDINEKKRAELALEESRQRYKSLFEYNLDGVFTIGLEGLYFLNANKAFEEIAGIDLGKLVDRCFIGMIFDEDHDAVYEALLGVMQTGEPRDIECRLAGMAGGERIVSITFVPILLGGRLNGIHGIMKDITKRKLEERELIRSEERSTFLRQSLSRLSGDLSGVMKVAELESRLLEEVEAVLRPADARIEEETGADPAPGLHDIRIRIGEKPQPVYLRIGLDRPLPKTEREWLDTAVRYATILYDNLHRAEDLMKRMEDMVRANETPKWMLRLLFKLSEKERAALSGDLHDSVLQDLIIWYRRLESLRSAGEFDERTERHLIPIEEGLLDAIHQIRITCNELRPPFLLKMGLVESLKSLFAYARMFANYEIEFAAGPMAEPLNEEQILGMYRIVQELLNNASKHSRASKVTIALTDDGDRIRFAYADDGVGTALSALEGSFRHMGIAGIEKRVQSLEGTVRLDSAPGQGFRAEIYFPKLTSEG